LPQPPRTSNYFVISTRAMIIQKVTDTAPKAVQTAIKHSCRPVKNCPELPPKCSKSCKNCPDLHACQAIFLPQSSQSTDSNVNRVNAKTMDSPLKFATLEIETNTTEKQHVPYEGLLTFLFSDFCREIWGGGGIPKDGLANRKNPAIFAVSCSCASV
jgi:hypothetical protein